MNGPVRVSHIAAFKRWREQDDSDLAWLINYLREGEENELMRKGTAFHKALELACESDNYSIHSDGYTFHFTGEMEIALPAVRELRRYKDYGGIVVTGQADGLLGNTIIDYKTTETFDAERYLSGIQHKFYMDIFGLDRFQWYVFECRLNDAEAHDGMPPTIHYNVNALHKLEQYRYPEMERECRELALEFKAFAGRWLPGFPYQPIQPPPKPTLKEQLRESVKLEPIWEMKATRGRNLISVGWRDGILRCAFAAKEGRRFYSYRNVPEAEYVKLLANPFPDRPWSALKAKHNWEAIKEAA